MIDDASHADASRKISIMFSDAPVIEEVNPAARPATSS
jgi:hypothetical protein